MIYAFLVCAIIISSINEQCMARTLYAKPKDGSALTVVGIESIPLGSDILIDWPNGNRVSLRSFLSAFMLDPMDFQAIEQENGEMPSYGEPVLLEFSSLPSSSSSSVKKTKKTKKGKMPSIALGTDWSVPNCAGPHTCSCPAKPLMRGYAFIRVFTPINTTFWWDKYTEFCNTDGPFPYTYYHITVECKPRVCLGGGIWDISRWKTKSGPIPKSSSLGIYSYHQRSQWQLWPPLAPTDAWEQAYQLGLWGMINSTCYLKPVGARVLGCASRKNAVPWTLSEPWAVINNPQLWHWLGSSFSLNYKPSRNFRWNNMCWHPGNKELYSCVDFKSVVCERGGQIIISKEELCEKKVPILR